MEFLRELKAKKKKLISKASIEGIWSQVYKKN